MTVPTLYNFTEALQAPDLAFSTLRDCRPRRTATGGVVLSRTSRFAEAEIEWQSRKYLLCFPLSTASIFAVEQTAARLRYLRTPLLTEYTILRDEMTYTDDTGTTRTCRRTPRPLTTSAILRFSSRSSVPAPTAASTICALQLKSSRAAR